MREASDGSPVQKLGMADEQVLGVEEAVDLGYFVVLAHFGVLGHFGRQQLSLHFLGKHHILKSHHLVIGLAQLHLQQVQHLFLLFEVFVCLPVLSLADELQDAGLVEPLVLLLLELQISQAVGLHRQVVATDFLQQRFHNFLILIDGLGDLLAQLVIKLPHFLVEGRDFIVLEVPRGLELLLDLDDDFDGGLGVLVGVGVLASAAEEEVLGALFVEADELEGLLVGGADLFRIVQIHK